MPAHGFIPPHGNDHQLHSYRKAEIIYDITFRFCERFIARGDRTRDQMIQAARSGKHKIAEGSAGSGTSTEIEIRLVGVARASLEELLNDYCDDLCVRDLRQWDKDSKEARFVPGLWRTAGRTDGAKRTNRTNRTNRSHESQESYEAYRSFIETRSAEVVANIAICLIHQADFLLDRQIKRLEKGFVEKGGNRERMTRARLNCRTAPSKPRP